MDRRDMLKTAASAAALAVVAPTALLAEKSTVLLAENPKNITNNGVEVPFEAYECDRWFSDNEEHRYFLISSHQTSKGVNRAKKLRFDQVKPGMRIAFQWLERNEGLNPSVTGHTIYMDVKGRFTGYRHKAQTNFIFYGNTVWSSSDSYELNS